MRGSLLKRAYLFLKSILASTRILLAPVDMGKFQKSSRKLSELQSVMNSKVLRQKEMRDTWRISFARCWVYLRQRKNCLNSADIRRFADAKGLRRAIGSIWQIFNCDIVWSLQLRRGIFRGVQISVSFLIRGRNYVLIWLSRMPKVRK